MRPAPTSNAVGGTGTEGGRSPWGYALPPLSGGTSPYTRLPPVMSKYVKSTAPVDVTTDVTRVLTGKVEDSPGIGTAGYEYEVGHPGGGGR